MSEHSAQFTVSDSVNTSVMPGPATILQQVINGLVMAMQLSMVMMLMLLPVAVIRRAVRSVLKPEKPSEEEKGVGETRGGGGGGPRA